MTDSRTDPGARYRERRTAFDRSLTVYGRKTVLEALQAAGVRCERLHLARSNRPSPILEQIVALATAQGAEIQQHGRQELARISRNLREDQGVAADIRTPGYRLLDDLLPLPPEPGAVLLAFDGVTNPQNLGMAMRSATAADCTGILLARDRGCDIGPLTIKASAGTVFRAPLLRCDRLADALAALRETGWRICILDATAARSLYAPLDDAARVFVLGSETSGVGRAVRELADDAFAIPMANGVESLNVAVTAALVAFRARYPGGTGKGA